MPGDAGRCLLEQPHDPRHPPSHQSRRAPPLLGAATPPAQRGRDHDSAVAGMCGRAHNRAGERGERREAPACRLVVEAQACASPQEGCRTRRDGEEAKAVEDLLKPLKPEEGLLVGWRREDKACGRRAGERGGGGGGSGGGGGGVAAHGVAGRVIGGCVAAAVERGEPGGVWVIGLHGGGRQ